MKKFFENFLILLLGFLCADIVLSFDTFVAALTSYAITGEVKGPVATALILLLALIEGAAIMTWID